MKVYGFIFLCILSLGSYLLMTDGPDKVQKERVPNSENMLSIDYAIGFQIEFVDNAKLVTVKNPWKDAEKVFEYLLVPKGESVPKGFPKAQVVRTPVERVVMFSSTHLPLIERLGLEESVVGFTDLKYLTPKLKKRADKIQELGQMTSPDMETLVGLKADLVITYGSGDPARDSHPKIIEMGIPTAMNAEYMERHPLGRFEWIKFVAVFFDQEKKAESVFNKVKNNYEKLAKEVAQIKERPKVLAGANIRGIFYAPGGRSYVAQLIEDAGGDYVWRDDDTLASQRLDLETAVEKGLTSEYWICHSLHKTKEELLKGMPQAKTFKAVTSGGVYSNNKPMEGQPFNDYWTRGLSNPDLHLADLVRIFHPKNAPEGDFQWYMPLK